MSHTPQVLAKLDVIPYAVMSMSDELPALQTDKYGGSSRCRHHLKCHIECANVPTAALLERQMVVFCPNIGILSAVVLSLVPLMRPFAWQSLLLPILPVQDKMLDLLEAPVPFILGVKVIDFFALSDHQLGYCECM